MSKTYITTWFYKEEAGEASYYPQIGGKGSSPLAHSVYMQIQVPFFVTFRHYNPEARFIFFTNALHLPGYLNRMFRKLDVEIVRLPYTKQPPQGWYPAWRNQFYLYDILEYMGQRMERDDLLLVSDADVITRRSLQPMFEEARQQGSALYEMAEKKPEEKTNGTSSLDMDAIYEQCYGEKPQRGINYYGGDFICLRGDVVARVNEAYPQLWQFNVEQFSGGAETVKLNEEAHFMSVLAERLHIRNATANKYFKRMWTNPHFRNVADGDERFTVWHIPYEKKRGLYYLYTMLARQDYEMGDEGAFWRKASRYCGIPRCSRWKRFRDFLNLIILRIKNR